MGRTNHLPGFSPDEQRPQTAQIAGSYRVRRSYSEQGDAPWRERRQRHRDRVGVPEVKALIDTRSGRVCELREVEFVVANPLFWLDVGDEVTTRYSYDGVNLVPPEAPALEEVRGLAIERVEHRAELELQAALGAKLPASMLLFQALSDELALFEADQAPTAMQYPLLASLVGKRGAVDLQRAAQLVVERRARWLQRAAIVEAVRLEALEDLEAAQSQEEIDSVLQRLDWGQAQRLSGETR
jgi:hypothetical protein